MIVLDIDGTLLNSRGQLTPRVRSAVARSIARGALVTVATGRRLRQALPVAAELGITAPLIVGNGGAIVEPGRVATIYHRPLPTEVALAATLFLGQHGLPAYLNRHAVAGPDLFFTHDPAETAAAHLVEEGRRYARQVDTLSEACTVPPLRVFALADAARVQAAARELPVPLGGPYAHLYCPDAPGTAILEFASWGVSKWSAVAWLARRSGIGAPEILAVGDNRNDLELLEHAGLGVAMGNALPEVQERARMVTETNDHDGVADVLERYVLEAAAEGRDAWQMQSWWWKTTRASAN